MTNHIRTPNNVFVGIKTTPITKLVEYKKFFINSIALSPSKITREFGKTIDLVVKLVGVIIRAFTPTGKLNIKFIRSYKSIDIYVNVYEDYV